MNIVGRMVWVSKNVKLTWFNVKYTCLYGKFGYLCDENNTHIFEASEWITLKFYDYEEVFFVASLLC